ncbi:MAG TPA: ester cyclase [Ktedonobacterales bacterium]|jgi:predicted ester cyclase|nr:ester cyclase [Ktedonobacterales bacterium]
MSRTPDQLVQGFFADIRSGHHLDRVNDYLAPRVVAHQIVGEDAHSIVVRTPEDYADHVREMLATYGDFTLQIEERLVQEDRVYVRWRQTGVHRAEIEGFPRTERPIDEVASAVYRIEDDRVVEYWIQVDRYGLRLQLERLSKIA